MPAHGSRNPPSRCGSASPRAPPLGGRTAAPIAEAIERIARALEDAGAYRNTLELAGSHLSRRYGRSLLAGRNCRAHRGTPPRTRPRPGRERDRTDLPPRLGSDPRPQRARLFGGTRRQNRITRAMAAAFAPIDVLLLPSAADFPPPVGTFPELNYEAWGEAPIATRRQRGLQSDRPVLPCRCRPGSRRMGCRSAPSLSAGWLTKPCCSGWRRSSGPNCPASAPNTSPLVGIALSFHGDLRCSNSGRIANVAARTCRRTRRTR